MDTEELRRQAIRKGLQLKPLSPLVRETLVDLAEGRRKAAEIAARRLIEPTAASNRLAALARLGLAEDIGSRGREKVYRLTVDGRTARRAIQ